MKAFVIAEIGSNWEGDIKTAKKLIQKCKNAGADAVKFQMWRAEDLYSVKHPLWKFIKKSELTVEKAKKIKEFCDSIKIEFFCSVFFPEGVEFLEQLKVKRYKIASRTCLFKDPFSLETMRSIALTKKPIIISMGMGGKKSRISTILKHNKTTFCYCISKYPTDFTEINWRNALRYEGFSDHTMSNAASILFVAFKKQQHTKNIYIEKHVKLENSRGPDAQTSITTEQFSELISQIRVIEKTCFS